MKIKNFDLDKNILIIAEIGNNHEGSYNLAEKMIHVAAKAGADAVKFQTIIPEKLITSKDQNRIQQLNKFKLSFNEFERLSKIAKRENVIFLSTPFDLESANFLNEIVPAFKISSGDNNFYQLIKYVCGTGKPIILSSGLTDMTQITFTRNFIKQKWQDKGISQELAILHCVSRYPTPFEDANLQMIKELKKLDVTVGYSDHTMGIEAAIISAKLGARIIEKHFTIDKNYSSFHDHKLSADVDEFSQLVKRVREVREEEHVDLPPQTTQHIFPKDIRRSIAASRELEKGTVISVDDLMWVRPGVGFSPGEEGKVLGKVLQRLVQKGEIFLEGDF